MLDDILLGKRLLASVGDILSIDEQLAISKYRHLLPTFIETEQGSEAVKLLLTSFIQHVEKIT